MWILLKCREAVYQGKSVKNRARSACFKALFWGPKKVEPTASTDLSLGEFNLTTSLGNEVNVCIFVNMIVCDFCRLETDYLGFLNSGNFSFGTEESLCFSCVVDIGYSIQGLGCLCARCYWS